ncbi:MAG TPA: cysteine synthase family protein [Thermomicrobiales bacterium]|nr:cysteine synthase family protein [Thermomicrobiales bacterium]
MIVNLKTTTEIDRGVDSLLATSAVVRAIGNTPLLRLTRVEHLAGLAPDVELWLKAEWTNPGGSVKDRPALAIVQDALHRGEIGPDRPLIDSTSGNTGIAFAMLGAALGFPVHLVVPGSASLERKQILSAYGATVIESDPYEGSDGAIRLVRSMVEEHPGRWFYADQYGNPMNPESHFRTTGPEIVRQTGARVTHLVAGLGTTGTLVGTGRYLKQHTPDVELVAVQPAEPFHGIEGLKHLPTAIVPPIYDERVPDMQVRVTTEDAFDTARMLARTEGIFAGTSTGAAVAGAIGVGTDATDAHRPAVIVVIAPDNGSKYLTTGLWGHAEP